MKNREKLQATGKKRCTRCKKLQPRDNFNNNSRTRDGLRAKCRECDRKERAEQRQHYRSKIQDQPPSVKVRRVYNISMSVYLEMFLAQNGLCAICKNAEKRKGRDGRPLALSIDRNRETGGVRGLLCHDCILLIGRAKGDMDLLASCIEYLARSKPDSSLG